jgi:hypothetical protein
VVGITEALDTAKVTNQAAVLITAPTITKMDMVQAVDMDLATAAMMEATPTLALDTMLPHLIQV